MMFASVTWDYMPPETNTNGVTWDYMSLEINSYGVTWDYMPCHWRLTHITVVPLAMSFTSKKKSHLLIYKKIV